MSKWRKPILSGLLAGALLGAAVPAAAVLEIRHINSTRLPTIDGDISEWIARWPTPHLNQANFTSTFGELLGPVPESDQKVEVWLGWNDQTDLIYIAARVTDDHFGTTSSGEVGEAWKSDNMEIYIDADNSGGTYSPENAHAQQYVLNPAGKFGAVLQQLGSTDPPQTQSAVKKVGNVYTYEMVIPGWDALDVASGTGDQHNFKAQQVIGLTIVFGDFESTENADGIIYHAFNGLNGPVGAFMDADQFTDFRLKGLVVSQTKAGGLFERRRGSKPVAVESSSWGEIKAQTAAEAEEDR